MMRQRLLFITLLASLINGCENFSSSTPPQTSAADYHKVLPEFLKPKPAKPAANTPNLKPSHTIHHTHTLGTAAVDEANKNAIIQPSSASTINSIIVYPFEAGELYQIYTTPLNITDVELQPGEETISIAAGDTARWQISKTLSGNDATRTEHLLIKPSAENLDTTLVVTTNQRTYHMLLKSTKNTYMSTVQWKYHDPDNMDGTTSDTQASSNLSLKPESLNFSYRTKLTSGDTPDWMPKAIFNDGSKTYIEFPDHIQSAPTLFIKQSGSGDAAVNYRVVGHYYVIDQVITSAELTSGMGRYQTVVEIGYKK